MSLSKEDLKAISDLFDVKLDNYDKKNEKRFEAIDKRFDAIDKKFEEHDKRFDAIDKKFVEQDKKLDKKLEDLKQEFKEMLTDNNLLIAEHVQRVVSESEERLSKEIKEIKIVTADNCYNIVSLKNKIS